jgi:hypothetical protein
VKLPKRFDLARAAEHWSAQLSTLIERELFSHNSQFCGLDQARGRPDPQPQALNECTACILNRDIAAMWPGCCCSDRGPPDLELVDCTTSIGAPRFGCLCALLVWHEQDLVDTTMSSSAGRAIAVG